MPVRMINFVTSKPPLRKNHKVIQSTEEWEDFVMALGAGLKPQEYITVHFPKEHEIWKESRDPHQSFLSSAKDKIKKLQLPYDAYIRNGVIYVVGRGVIS